MLTPCFALELLALVTFLGYCAATRQPRRAIAVILIALAVGLTAVIALNALFRQGQDTFVGRYDFLPEDTGVAWLQQWGRAIMAAADIWAGSLVCLQWPAEWRCRKAQLSAVSGETS